VDRIKRAWCGDEKLWVVFWIYGVIPNSLFVICSQSAIHFPDTSLSKFGIAPVLLTVLLTYLVWSLVSIWRCAFNTKWLGWGYIARTIVILEVIQQILGLLLIAYISILWK